MAAGLETIARLSAREWRVILAARDGSGDMGNLPDKAAALLEVSRALREAGIPHAVIGGVAVGVRSGVPRATLDTDLAVLAGVARDVVVATLVSAGLVLRGEFTHSVNFRHTSGEPVQIVQDASFDAMIQRAEFVDLGSVRVPVVTTEDLIAMKEQAAADPARRPSKALRDRADVAMLRGDVPDPEEGW
jgi:hypothetical protein